MAEDYVEAIAEAISENGICRAVDLVRHFDVTHATVSNTISRLQRDGLVVTEPYQPITLTAQGKRMATKARRRAASSNASHDLGFFASVSNDCLSDRETTTSVSNNPATIETAVSIIVAVSRMPEGRSSWTMI